VKHTLLHHAILIAIADGHVTIAPTDDPRDWLIAPDLPSDARRQRAVSDVWESGLATSTSDPDVVLTPAGVEVLAEWDSGLCCMGLLPPRRRPTALPALVVEETTDAR
jgi:hypothetical protein